MGYALGEVISFKQRDYLIIGDSGRLLRLAPLGPQPLLVHALPEACRASTFTAPDVFKARERFNGVDAVFLYHNKGALETNHALAGPQPDSYAFFEDGQRAEMGWSVPLFLADARTQERVNVGTGILYLTERGEHGLRMVPGQALRSCDLARFIEGWGTLTPAGIELRIEEYRAATDTIPGKLQTFLNALAAELDSYARGPDMGELGPRVRSQSTQHLRTALGL